MSDSDSGTDRRSLDDQLDDLGRQLGELRSRVADQAGGARTALEPFIEQVKADLETARSMAERTGTAARDTARSAGDDASEEAKTLRAELATIRADVRAELADSAAAYRSAVGDVVDSWRARIDEARVQADLAGMDVRDQVEGEVDRAEHLWAELKVTIEKLVDEGAEATADLRAEVRRLIEDLRSALRSATERLRADGESGDDTA